MKKLESSVAVVAIGLLTAFSGPAFAPPVDDYADAQTACAEGPGIFEDGDEVRVDGLVYILATGSGVVNGHNDSTYGKRDLIFGGYGPDTLNGGMGDDILCGGGWGDTLNGGLGDDDLVGGGHGDTLNGGWGEDYLVGGGYGDKLYGGNDDDTLNGGGHGDLLDGGRGDDTLNGGGDGDDLRGGRGDDTCDPGTNDTYTNCEIVI